MGRQQKSEPAAGVRPWSSWHAHWREIGILILGALASSGLAWLDWSWESRQRATELRQWVEVSAEALDQRLQHLVNDVQVLAQFYGASNRVDGDEFARFTRPFLQRHPMLHALEWAPRVDARERDAFEADARAQGLEDFSIRELAEGRLRRAGARPSYFPVLRIEPLAGNEPAVGLDLGSEPRRQAALQRACETGQPVASAPVALVQETASQRALLLFAPQYAPDLETATPADRCARLQGFAAGVLRLGDLVESALARLPDQPLDLVLRDAEVAGEDGLLHVHPSPIRAADAPLSPTALALDPRGHEVAIRVAGRHLVLRGVPTDRIGPSATIPVVLLLLGLSVTGGFTALVWNRRRAAQRLRASEARLRLLIEHVPAALAMFDRDLRYLATSRRWSTDYGLGAGDLVGRPHYEIFPEISERLRDVHRRALAGETIRASADRFERADGSVQWLHWEVCPWHASEGQVGGIVVFSEDITDRKSAEEALRRYRQIVETSNEMLAFVDRELRYLLVNPAYAALYGTTPEALQGRRVEEVVSPEVQAELLPQLRAVLAGESRHIALHGRDPAGRSHWIETTLRPFLEQGTVLGIVASLHDQTEVREAQAALEAERAHLEERVATRTAELRRSEDKLRAIINLAPVGISITDPSGRLVDCNRAAETILGLPRDAHLTRTFDGPEWRILRPDGSAMPAEEFASVRALTEQRPIRDLEMGIVTREGVHWILVSAVPSPHPDYGVIVVYVDISERKQAEAARQTAEAALHASERRFRSLFTASKVVMLIIDPETGTIVDANPSASAYYGYPLDSLRGQSLSVIHTLSPEQIGARLGEAVQTGRGHFLVRHRLASGEVRDVEVHSSPLELEGRTVLHAIVHDITAQAAAETALRNTLADIERHDAQMIALNRMNDLLLACDTRAEAYQVITRATEHLFDGCSGGLAILEGDDSTRLRSVATWGEAGRLAAEFPLAHCWALRRGEVHEVVATTGGAQCRHFAQPPVSGYLCVPLSVRGETFGLLHLGAPPHRSALQRQELRTLAVAVSEAVKLALSSLALRERLRAQALRDPLTGLFNRRYLEETLPRLLARAQHQGEPLALAMLDVDHFKRVNDTHGHEAGDAVLRTLGALLARLGAGGGSCLPLWRRGADPGLAWLSSRGGRHAPGGAARDNPIASGVFTRPGSAGSHGVHRPRGQQRGRAPLRAAAGTRGCRPLPGQGGRTQSGRGGQRHRSATDGRRKSSSDADTQRLRVSIPMDQDTSPALPDLSQCDQEPIHIPGAIQPHGVLLALHGPALRITQVSTSCETLLGLAPSALLERELAAVLGATLAEAVGEALARYDELPAAPVSFTWRAAPQAQAFSAHVHRCEPFTILELEPLATATSISLGDTFAQALRQFSAVRAQPRLAGKLDAAARLFRQLTGYDRVMIYRFDADWHGEVIAEARRADLEPFLGLHYPASDIPSQARRLYLVSPTRLIADIDAIPAALVPLCSTRSRAGRSISRAASCAPSHPCIWNTCAIWACRPVCRRP